MHSDKPTYQAHFLIITSEFPPLPGGIGNHAFGLYQGLKNLGYEVKVITNGRDPKEESAWLKERKDAQNVSFLKRRKFVFITYLDRILYSWRAVQRLKQKGNKNRVLFSGKFSVWILALLPQRHWYQSCAIIHGSEIKQSGLGKRLFQKGLNKASIVISVSSYTRQKLHETYELDKVKSFVINNGFIPSSASKTASTPKSDTLQLITIGNLTRRKGQLNVIKALPEIKKRIPHLLYTMVGIPTEQEMLKAQINEFSLHDDVVITGKLEEEQKWEQLSQSHIFMMLSEELKNGDFEGFGIAILEANSLGIPTIGSLNSGIADAIKHGYSGLLVDPHNLEEIAEAVRTIMADYDGFSQRAKEHAETFRWERKVGEYLGVISDGRRQTADRRRQTADR